MPAGYSSQPISGFTGHIPGAKWQVGSRYSPNNSQIQIKNENNQHSHPHPQGLPPHPSGQGGSQLGGNRQRYPEDQDLDPVGPPYGEFVEEIPWQDGGGNQFSNSRQGPFVQGSQGQQMLQGARQGINHIRQQGQNFADGQLGTQRNSNLGPPGGPSNMRPGSSDMSIGFPVRIPNDGPDQYDGGRGYAQGGPGGQRQNGIPQSNSAQFQPQRQTRYDQSQGSRLEEERSEAAASVKQRSKSVPRRIEKDPFEGVDGGWWSKGEVMRNKERREMANRGQAIAGGNFDQKLIDVDNFNRRGGGGGGGGRPWKERLNEENDIPTAGYSGHLPGFKQTGVGKSFNAAAKEAKLNYLERRRARSGSRDQFNPSQSGVYSESSEVLNPYPANQRSNYSNQYDGRGQF